MTAVHHYAPCAHLPRIMASGALVPSNAGAEGERSLLWFSANQRWEPTATKYVIKPTGELVELSLAQQLELFGCCRFTMPANDPRLIPWLKACRFAGTSYTMQRKMEAAGKKRGGNPSQWFAIAGSVDIGALHFSVFDGSTWTPADISDTAKTWEEND